MAGSQITDGIGFAVLRRYLRFWRLHTDVGRKARDEEWEKGSDGFEEEDDGSVEVEAELAEGEEDGGDLL